MEQIKRRTNTITLGIPLHHKRPARCYPSIQKQKAKTKIIEHHMIQNNNWQNIKKNILTLLNRLAHAETSYIGLWMDDVAIQDENYLKNLIKTVDQNPHSITGLPNWSLGTDKRMYPNRAWLTKTEWVNPIEFEDLSDKAYGDVEVIWMIDNKLQGIIINTDWNHWIPINLNALNTPGYVLEEYDNQGNHRIQSGITLHVDKNQKFNIHPLLFKECFAYQNH